MPSGYYNQSIFGYKENSYIIECLSIISYIKLIMDIQLVKNIYINYN